MQRFLERGASELDIVATYSLCYNASLMVEQGLGIALTLEGLVRTEGSELVFRPFSPALTDMLSVVWRKHKGLSRAAASYLSCLKEVFDQTKVVDYGEQER